MKKYLKNTCKISLIAALACTALLSTQCHQAQQAPQEPQIQLPSIITDGMVVQRGRPVALWGKSNSGAAIEAYFENGQKAATTADSDGNWTLELPEQPVGGPYTLHINDITIHDVMCGDVFLCSGQSNMELPIRRVTDMFGEETSTYANEAIRHYRVPHETEFHTELFDTDTAAWEKTNPETAREFSSLAYFIAKEKYAIDSIPVGIINASWGGTPIEAWINQQYLEENYPYAAAQKKLYEDDAYRQHIKEVEGENYAHWNALLYSSDLGMGVQKWYDPKYDDSDWQEVDLFSTDWATDGMNPVNGSHWFRKEFTLTKAQSKEDAVLRLGRLIDADSVYVNGVFVGTTGYEWPPRIYDVPAKALNEGANNVTVRVISQHGYPHFVADKPYKLITSDGEIALDGMWKYHLGARMPEGPDMMFWHYVPTVLYNAMIAPVIKYPVSAAVWYQGESNVERSNAYPLMLELLTSNWRAASGNPEMPFYIVELADFLPLTDTAGREAWAQMRMRQTQACDSIPGAYLIENIDLGEWNDIHPLNKKTLAERVVAKFFENQSQH